MSNLIIAIPFFLLLRATQYISAMQFKFLNFTILNLILSIILALILYWFFLSRWGA